MHFCTVFLFPSYHVVVKYSSQCFWPQELCLLRYSDKANEHLLVSTHPVSGCGESFESHCPWVAEEGALLPQACPEGVEVYRQVHHEGALGQADLQEEVLVMTSHFPHPRYDLREEGEEGVL